MEIYKLKSLILILIIYLIAMLPTLLIFIQSKSCSSKKSFLKALCLCTIIQVIIFSVIYAIPRTLIHFFKVAPNIENYSIYALKILFIGVVFTPIHYGFPVYLFRQEKKKKAFILFSLKIIYIPIFIFVKYAFTMQTALFAVPILDLIYSVFYFFLLYKF